MAAVDSHDCSWEASGCVRRSFLVCFWYDLSAVSKIAWKRDSEEGADVDGVEDMTRACEYRGGLRGIVDGDCEQGRGQTPPRGQVSHLRKSVSAYNGQ